MQFDSFFQNYRGSAFSVRTLDGWSWNSSEHLRPRLIATFRANHFLDAVIGSTSDAALGRTFLDGDLDIQGDICILLAVAQYILSHSEGLNRNLIRAIGRFCFDLHRRLKPATRAAEHRNWHCCPCPVDLPSHFFESWLGPQLGHACAVLMGPESDFRAAQAAGLQRACASLDLDRGEHLLDLGCGWGALLLHAAEAYGAEVQGIASSDSQAQVAADRICDRGLQRYATVECRDIRAHPFSAGSFDKISDIGVFEQVRSVDLASYLACIRQMLAPQGLLTLHRMTRSRNAAGSALCSLCPDLVLEPLAHDLQVAEAAGLEIVRLESLDREYEFTLRTWIDHLRTNWTNGTACGNDEVLLERGRRAWLLYLVELTTYLESRELQVHGITLRRASTSKLD